jgi:hypothetical protein
VRVVVAAARRSDGGGPRDRSWDYARARWERIGWPVVEGHHDPADGELFNLSAARNAAAAAADEAIGRWDVLLVVDADVILERESQATNAALKAIATGRLTFAHDFRSELSEVGTAALLAGEQLEQAMARSVERRNPNSNSSALAVPRPLWDDVRGFDERFVGWGWEDLAFRASCSAAAGGYERVPGDVVHLWHPRSLETNEGQPAHGMNWQLGETYLALEHDTAGMRDLIARRDEPWWFCGCSGASMVMGPRCAACGREAP